MMRSSQGQASEVNMSNYGRLRAAVSFFLLILTFFGFCCVSQYFRIKVSKALLAKGGSYDVIVVGTDPEGIAAAVSSARNGMSTLLIDKRDRLGGLWTLGGLNVIDMNRASRVGLVTRGIFKEFYNANGGMDSFELDRAESIFNDMVDREAKLVVKLDTEVEGIVMNGNVITGIIISEGGKRQQINAKRTIDATQDADIAAWAGVPYYIGMEDINCPKDHQPLTLIFKLGNVNWERLQARSSSNDSGLIGIDEDSAWGFYGIMQRYDHISQNIGMRGLNIGRDGNGYALINSLQILGVDPLDDAAKRWARQKAVRELPPLTRFISDHIPGFGNVYLIGAMPELYVRESRHIVGQYRLTANDVIENRDFPDKIALGAYPVDIQRTSVYSTGIIIGNPIVYSIPIRCIVPLRVENLLVVGRSASYSSLAHGSARTVPVGMAVGQAAGVACRYSIHRNIPFYKIYSNPVIHDIQDTLRKQGALLIKLNYGYPCRNHWALGSIRFLRNIGVVAGGYNNDYGLRKRISSLRLINMTIESEKRCFIKRNGIQPDIMQLTSINGRQAAQLLLYLAGQNYRVSDPISWAAQLGILSMSTAQRVARRTEFNRAVWFTMLTDFIHYRRKNGEEMQRIGPHITPFTAPHKYGL